MTMTIVRPKPPTMASSAPSSNVATATKTAPARRPAPPKAVPVLTLPKEEQQRDEQREIPKAKKAGKPAPLPSQAESHPASEFVVPAGQPADSGEPDEDISGEEAEELTGQLTIYQLPKLNLVEKHKLWRKLNEDTNSRTFITILRPDSYPKKVVREDPPKTRPDVKNAMWCCYCGDWTIFQNFAYVGSNRCICCGISTKDYHNRGANKLWQVDL